MRSDLKKIGYDMPTMHKPNQEKQKIFVAIAGNIGVGKTTLTRLLSQKLRWRAYYEKVIDNPYLALFYDDMERWSFHLQIFFLSHRFKSLKEISEWPDSCIQDRSIYEDVEIFARTLHEQGFMSAVDYDNYRMLFSTMVEYLRKPDLIIYLRASVDRLVERILSRGRDFEQTIDRGYLERLGNAYERWIDEAEEEGFKILRIDTENKNFEENENDLNFIINFVKEMEKQSCLNMD
jgi:deoxyadenosine/deoxycytidine kinase